MTEMCAAWMMWLASVFLVHALNYSHQKLIVCYLTERGRGGGMMEERDELNIKQDGERERGREMGEGSIQIASLKVILTHHALA